MQSDIRASHALCSVVSQSNETRAAQPKMWHLYRTQAVRLWKLGITAFCVYHKGLIASGRLGKDNNARHASQHGSGIWGSAGMMEGRL